MLNVIFSQFADCAYSSGNTIVCQDYVFSLKTPTFNANTKIGDKLNFVDLNPLGYFFLISIFDMDCNLATLHVLLMYVNH